MQKEFWLNMWENNDIPFHQEEVKQELIRYFGTLNLSKNSTVLVPFCGKSKDLLWLSQRVKQVIGIEISEIACHDLFKEMQVQPTIIRKATHIIFQYQNIQILHGDLFQIDDLPNIQCIYDCKALIALPPAARKKYVTHLLNLTDHNAMIFLIAISTNDSVRGPPFPVSDIEIQKLYADYKIQQLEQKNVIDLPNNLMNNGYQTFNENVYLLTRRKMHEGSSNIRSSII